MNRALPVHQSSCTADIFPQCHRVPAVNIYYVEMSTIGSLGTSMAQVPDCERSFLIIFPLHQQAVGWGGGVAYIHLHMCLHVCVCSLNKYIMHSVSLHNCTSYCIELLMLIFSIKRIYCITASFASCTIFQMHCSHLLCCRSMQYLIHGPIRYYPSAPLITISIFHCYM